MCGRPMSKPKAAKAATVKTLQVHFPADGDVNRQTAELATEPSVQGAMSINQWRPVSNDVELGSLVAELQKQARLANSGDLSRSEAILALQAQALAPIFNDLVRRAKAAEYLSQFEAYMRCGLKAQSQCRATLETLAAIKNPAPATFVRQANIAHGPQQVNNAPSTSMNEASRARE